MIYAALFISFLFFVLFDLIKQTESRRNAMLMGAILFLLVALRASAVGPDTSSYIQLFNTGIYGNDLRDMEALFLGWSSLWKSVGIGEQAYLIICAIVSIGSVVYVIWKTSAQRVWSYALFVFVFSWYFYLSGIRQSIAMGCFSMGVYLLNKNLDFTSLADDRFTAQMTGVKRWIALLSREFRRFFNRNNLAALFFIALAPMFHTSALFAVLVLFIVLLDKGRGRYFYIIAISVSFLITVSGVFRSAEQILENGFNMLSGDMDISGRYEGYLDDEYTYDTSLYLILKSCLPINFIALLALLFRKRRFRMFERFFFWLVILNNLFFYFSYMFRLSMYVYPFASIAIANLLYPVARNKNMVVCRIGIAVFLILSAYVSYVNLVAQPQFDYTFFFS